MAELSFLGKALEQEQLMIMAGSVLFWEVSYRVSTFFIMRFWQVDRDVAKQLGLSVASSIHAIECCMLSLLMIFTVAKPDSLYERIPISQVNFAISTGYFVWDLIVVIFYDRFSVEFLLHASSCLLCYLFGQFPFLNYWGAYFLLFELSTPLLHVRKAMLVTGNKESPWMPTVENAFGLLFFVARIVVGIPMSLLVWRDLLRLLAEPEKAHSTLIIYYYLAADTLLCGLNVYWFALMCRKQLKPKQKSKKEKDT
jgi:hypothetical protein